MRFRRLSALNPVSAVAPENPRQAELDSLAHFSASRDNLPGARIHVGFSQRCVFPKKQARLLDGRLAHRELRASQTGAGKQQCLTRCSRAAPMTIFRRTRPRGSRTHSRTSKSESDTHVVVETRSEVIWNPTRFRARGRGLVMQVWTTACENRVCFLKLAASLLEQDVGGDDVSPRQLAKSRRETENLLVCNSKA